MNIVLLVCHKEKAPGADAHNGVSEYDYWKNLVMGITADMVAPHIVKFAYRDGLYITDAVKKASELFSTKPDIFIELHFNSYNKKAMGCEAWYGLYSRDLADKFCKFMESKGRVNRGPKSYKGMRRGKINVVTAQKYAEQAMLIEPFFGDNKNDYIPVGIMQGYLCGFIRTLPLVRSGGIVQPPPVKKIGWLNKLWRIIWNRY